MAICNIHSTVPCVIGSRVIQELAVFRARLDEAFGYRRVPDHELCNVPADTSGRAYADARHKYVSPLLCLLCLDTSPHKARFSTRLRVGLKVGG